MQPICYEKKSQPQSLYVYSPVQLQDDDITSAVLVAIHKATFVGIVHVNSFSFSLVPMVIISFLGLCFLAMTLLTSLTFFIICLLSN